MSTRTSAILIGTTLAIGYCVTGSAQEIRGLTNPLTAAAVGQLQANPAPSRHAYNRMRWFWYTPQEWQFPGFLRPPAFFSLDATSYPPAFQPPQTESGDFAETVASESQTPRQFERKPFQTKAFRWDESTGRAEPLELKRWGGSRGSGRNEQ
jgi:hypothetical protein